MQISKLITSLLVLPIAACTTVEEPQPVELLSNEVALAATQESIVLEGVKMADGTRVARIVLHHDVGMQDPAGFDRDLANEYAPETVPAIEFGLRVEGFDDVGGLLFSSERAVNAPLASVRWQVRDGGALVTIDPANPADAATVTGYADVIDEIYDLRLDAPVTPTIPSAAVACDDGPQPFEKEKAAPGECFGRLLDLLATIKDTYEKIRKAWDECGKPNNEVACVAALGDAAIAIARLGLRGWDFYQKCWKASEDGKPGVILIPENKIIRPGDKEFVLPPGPIRQDNK